MEPTLIEASYDNIKGAKKLKKALELEVVEDIHDEDEEPTFVRTGKKATLEDMNDLHNSFTRYLIRRLESGEELSSGELSVISAHLKNNNISVSLIEDAPSLNLNSRITALLKQGMSSDEDDL